MGRAESVALIQAPVETVWNTLNDIAHTPDWVVGLEAADLKTPGNYGLDSIYYDHNRLGPLPQTTPWRVTAFEPMKRQIHESRSAVLPSRMILHLSPSATSEVTRLQMVVEYRFLPWLGPVSRLLERLVMDRALASVLRQNQANLNVYLASRR